MRSSARDACASTAAGGTTRGSSAKSARCGCIEGWTHPTPRHLTRVWTRQPQVKGDTPAFSFRQFLWRLKMLPFGCRGEKWLFLMRKRQFQVTPTEMAAEDFHYLARLHYAHRAVAGPAQAQQQRLIDLVGHSIDTVTGTQGIVRRRLTAVPPLCRTLTGRSSSFRRR